ncbi:three-helix bundle dimerization domain-containing protein [Micromonospora sp. WMMD736]|uniref:three-helix bundle dimerization domain-containing protein n=1 Tax=Micromonospora sp. WMMD736 TaxID=3404112 RepID=UPI003B96483C
MNEETLISEVIDRLAGSYPSLTREDIGAVVEELRTRFDGAPVREFVPLFVERRAHLALDELAVSYA